MFYPTTRTPLIWYPLLPLLGRRRPLLVTRHRVWIKPGVMLRYHFAKDVFPREWDEPSQKWRVQLIDAEDREYWVRLTEKQLWRLRNW